MAKSDQTGGGLSSCPDRRILGLSADFSKEKRKRNTRRWGTSPGMGNRQDLFKTTRGRLKPFPASPKTRGADQTTR